MNINRQYSKVMLIFGCGVATAVIATLSINIMARYEAHFNAALTSNILNPKGHIGPKGLYVEQVGERYLFAPKPVESDWRQVELIALGDNAFYPVYYTRSGFQVLRKNKANGLFVAHAWINGADDFFVIDTGATHTMLSNPDLLAMLSLSCDRQHTTLSVDKQFSVCSAPFDTLNLDGFYLKPSTQDRYVYTRNWKDPNRITIPNLLGMSTLKHFNFVIKDHYMHIKPAQQGHFLISPALGATL